MEARLLRGIPGGCYRACAFRLGAKAQAITHPSFPDQHQPPASSWGGAKRQGCPSLRACGARLTARRSFRRASLASVPGSSRVSLFLLSFWGAFRSRARAQAFACLPGLKAPRFYQGFCTGSHLLGCRWTDSLAGRRRVHFWPSRLVAPIPTAVRQSLRRIARLNRFFPLLKHAASSRGSSPIPPGTTTEPRTGVAGARCCGTGAASPGPCWVRWEAIHDAAEPSIGRGHPGILAWPADEAGTATAENGPPRWWIWNFVSQTHPVMLPWGRQPQAGKTSSRQCWPVAGASAGSSWFGQAGAS